MLEQSSRIFCEAEEWTDSISDAEKASWGLNSDLHVHEASVLPLTYIPSPIKMLIHQGPAECAEMPAKSSRLVFCLFVLRLFFFPLTHIKFLLYYYGDVYIYPYLKTKQNQINAKKGTKYSEGYSENNRRKYVVWDIYGHFLSCTLDRNIKY